MCFKKNKQKLVLPHPEEKENPDQTLDNVDVDKVLSKWMIDWEVPARNCYYWDGMVEVHLDPSLNFPAGAYEYQGKRHIVAKPSWFNPGVVAHEQAHNIYALLTEGEKVAWVTEFNIAKGNKLVKYMFSLHGYGKDNPVEGHADIYRYLGQSMPEQLKYFYPRLF
jgi:hypothetical protein